MDTREDQLLLAMEMKTFSMGKITERMNSVHAERKRIEEQRQAVIAECDSEPAFLQDRELVLLTPRTFERTWENKPSVVPTRC